MADLNGFPLEELTKLTPKPKPGPKEPDHRYMKGTPGKPDCLHVCGNIPATAAIVTSKRGSTMTGRDVFPDPPRSFADHWTACIAVMRWNTGSDSPFKSIDRKENKWSPILTAGNLYSKMPS